MSGAEAAIAGIGFLCNAMQIVTFGRDILQVYSHVRNEHCPDPRLKAYLESAKACFDDMNSSAVATSQALPPSRDQQQIIEIGKKLEESMAQLQSKFSELHIDDASRRGFRGKIEVGRKSLSTLWQGKELESLEINLKRYESLLHGVVLHRICNQSQAAEISSQQSFHQLNTNLQSVITQLADGRTWMSDLSIESRETRKRITQEHETTRAAINTGFNTTNGAISSFRDSVSREFQDMARRDEGNGFEKERNELLRSIRFPEMDSRKNHISENYPGTFDWVFKSPFYCSRCRSPTYEQSDDDSVEQREEQTDDEDMDYDEDMDDDEGLEDSPMAVSISRSSNLNYFPAWLESDAQQFWISGKPASGKSSLMKFLATNPITLQHLQAQHSNIRILTHYFWKPGQPLQKSIEGMTRSLLHQVLQKNRDLAQRLWTAQPIIQDKRDRGDWDMNELRKALCWAIKFSGNTFCIFLDGLDEAKEFEDLPWGDHQNTQVIYDLLSLNNIKLCASSREEGHFCQFFADQPRLRTHQLNENDIYHYAENSLEVSGLSFYDRSRLLETVVQKANGVFLWVVLAVKSLNKAIRSGGANEFEERLSQTPSDLHDLLVDMWERPGDDAKLLTRSIEASRFFSLSLAAIRMEEISEGYYNFDETLPLHSMRSLLTMTTALEDKSFTSILREGRDINAKELEARCARAEDRMRLVCRGLLEVTTLNDECRDWVGNEALFNYALKRVNFIHRCAFDFVTDTQYGRECLVLCHWSSIEQAERLLAGHLVKSRFLCHVPPRYRLRICRGRTEMDFYEHIHQLDTALYVTLNWPESNMSFRNSMIEKLKDWQQCGLFYEHLYWKYPIFPKVPSNPRELEFLESVIWTADSEDLFIDLVEQLSIFRLVEAIPVLLLSLVDPNGFMSVVSCLNLIDYILTRLQSATVEGYQDYSLELQHDVRHRTRLLHSWFVMQCLHRLYEDWSKDWDEITDLLHRFSRTLCSMDDWQSPLILEFGVDSFSRFRPQDIAPYHFGSSQCSLVVGNFVTAYRLLDQLLQDEIQNETDCALQIQLPRDARERFDILLIRGNADPQGNDKKFFSPATEYHLDIANCIKESLSERDVQVREQRWSALFRDINTGLQWIGKDTLGYCIREVNKRGLKLIHPWVNAVIIDS